MESEMFVTLKETVKTLPGSPSDMTNLDGFRWKAFRRSSCDALSVCAREINSSEKEDG